MLSLKKISRHIPRKILYPSVTEPKTVFALSSTQRLASFRSWQTSFPVPASTHIYRTVSLHLPIPLFFLFFLFVSSAHLFYIDIFSRKDKIRARGYTTRFAIYISRFHHVENRVGGTEVSLVSPLLREKEFECISTFLRETCSICSSYFLTCSLAIFVQSFTACLQIVFLFSFFVFA